MKFGMVNLSAALCLLLNFASQNFAQMTVARVRSQLVIHAESGPINQQFVIRGERGQECAMFFSDKAGRIALQLDKVASNENLQILQRNISGEEEYLATIPGEVKISPLAKPRTDAVMYQLPIRTYFARGVGRESSGKFTDLDEQFMTYLHNMGVDYLWITGAIEYANLENTDADAVKGDAGSYYALRDMWDVSEHLGDLADLEHVIELAHAHGIRVLLDLVPNHTARIHQTDVLCKGDLNFGGNDDHSQSFSPQNNYYYLPGTYFSPPAQHNNPLADGVFDTDPTTPGLQLESPARVTGNDVMHPSPSIDDWYETAKLNYGIDLFGGRHSFSSQQRTWQQILDVATYWLQKGVDGFRLDFTHVVPIEFWSWLIPEIRKVNPEAFLVAEAYEAAASFDFSYERLFGAGIDSIFQSELYWRLHNTVRSTADVRGIQLLNVPAMRPGVMFHGYKFTNYMENHDEVRVASPHALPTASEHVTRAALGLVASVISGLMPGHFLIHGGQEFGEDAHVIGDYAGDRGKTSIFDFIYQPYTLAWWSGNAAEISVGLAPLYQKLHWLKKRAPFNVPHRLGAYSFYDLQAANWQKPQSANVLAYVRVNPINKEERYLVVANLHPTASVETTLHFTDRVNTDSFGILSALGIKSSEKVRYRFTDVFSNEGFVINDPAVGGEGIPGSTLYQVGGVPSGLYIGQLPAATVLVLKIEEI